MISRVLRERELAQIERVLEVFERTRDKLRALAAPGERTRLEDIADRLGKLVDLARVGRALLVAMVQQGGSISAPWCGSRPRPCRSRRGHQDARRSAFGDTRKYGTIRDGTLELDESPNARRGR